MPYSPGCGIIKITITKIAAEIAGLPGSEWQSPASLLMNLPGWGRLGETREREMRKMPVCLDILENGILGPAYKVGLQEGKLEANLEMLRHLIDQR